MLLWLFLDVLVSENRVVETQHQQGSYSDSDS